MAKFLIAIFVISNFIIIQDARAASATLFVSPGTGKYQVGKSFTVNIMVNSGGGSGINAGEASLKYDPSILTVKSVTKGSSVFSLWTTEPTFSNGNGTITFGGGSPSPYKGTAGNICTVTFSAKKAGDAEVKFTNGVVSAADGLGTNILSGFGSGKYSIEEAPKEEPKKEEPKKEEAKKPEKKPETKETTSSGMVPPLPEISTQTHPDENAWYQSNDPEFKWKLLPDLIGVSYSVTSDPLSDPGTKSEGVVESKKIDNVKDGLLYFHLKYQNKSGWSPIAHKKFRVDAKAPAAFLINVDNSGDKTEPSPKLRFKTSDETSGIDYYKANLNGATEKIAPSEVENGYYQLRPTAPGSYNVVIEAYDKAGNVSSSSAAFIIEPLKAPIITSIPKQANKDEQLIIQGTSFYPRVTVKIYIKPSGSEEAQEYSVKTDEDGNWSYFHSGDLAKGVNEVWAKMIDDRGAQSLDSTKYIMNVVARSIIERFGFYVFLLMALIILSLIIYIYYERRKFNDERLRIKGENDEAKAKLAKIFSALREEVDELIEMADKRVGLSESERKVKEKLQESLDISEEFIGKEIDDVEKEIRLVKRREK